VTTMLGPHNWQVNAQAERPFRFLHSTTGGTGQRGTFLPGLPYIVTVRHLTEVSDMKPLPHCSVASRLELLARLIAGCSSQPAPRNLLVFTFNVSGAPTWRGDQ